MILKMSQNQFKDSMPECISNQQGVSQELKDDMWTTVLVLEWLNKTKKAQKMSWKLMANKSKSWIRKQKFDLTEAWKTAGALIK